VDLSNLGKPQRAHIFKGTAGHSTKQLITFRGIRGTAKAVDEMRRSALICLGCEEAVKRL